MKIRKIALALLLSVSVNMVGSQLAFAAETKSVTASTIESKLGDLDNFNAFNPNKMTENEKKAYNKSIDKQVEVMKKKYGKNFNSKQFRANLVKILETEGSLKNTKATINSTDSLITTSMLSDSWVPDICISNDYVSAAIAVIIDGILAASGVGSVALLVREIGIYEAKRIFTKSIKSKLKAWGCAAFVASAGVIADFILNALSPEDMAAEYLDSIDSYPNDGYFDVIL